MSDLDSSQGPGGVIPLPGLNLPELSVLTGDQGAIEAQPAQSQPNQPKEGKDSKIKKIITYEYVTVERSMKYEKDGTPVTLVPSTQNFMLTLDDGKVIIPYRSAIIYFKWNSETYFKNMGEIIDGWKSGGNDLKYLQAINTTDTRTYEVLVPVSENPMGGGQRRKTRNYKKKYSRKVSSSSRKYKTRR
jgi:hypothetical protein